MKVLAFAASLRRGSWNRKLVELGARIAKAAGAEVELVDFHEFDMPPYDADLDGKEGPPHGTLALRTRLDVSEAVLIATPEYNYSIAGLLKNAIDWVSRCRPMPWRGKSIYLMSASPSPMGGIRGLWQARVPLEGCGAFVFPDMFALAHADKAFKPNGTLVDAGLSERFEREIVGFVRLATVMAPIVGKPAALTPEQREILMALEDESELQPPATA
ncbi:MAG: NADPH-dependent FMN reductase [Myxococcaceae bacterium]